jgi:hypothetical protein
LQIKGEDEMSLVIEIRNVTGGLGEHDIAGYSYEVWVTTLVGKKVIAEGEIGGHMRSDGWRKLVQRVCDESVDVG